MGGCDCTTKKVNGLKYCKSGCNTVLGCDCTTKKVNGARYCASGCNSLGGCGCTTKKGKHWPYMPYKSCSYSLGHCYRYAYRQVNKRTCSTTVGHCYEYNYNYVCLGARFGSQLVGQQCCSWIS